MTAGDSGSTDRIARAFERIRADGRVGLMTHIVLGYPTLDASREIVDRMVAAGVDLIEIQIPFSDPTADGPVITQACQTALDAGIRVEDAFAFLEDVSARYPDTPFLFMSYFNIAFAYRCEVNGGRGGEDGVRGFVAATAAAGGSGLILPDVPPDMTDDGYPEACADTGIHPVWVVSPNVSDDRLRVVGEVASGFLYATSRTGTTGKDVDIETKRLTGFLARARDICGVPLAVGFSISSPEDVESLRGHADVAVIGTHLIRAYEGLGADGVEREVARLRGDRAE